MEICRAEEGTATINSTGGTLLDAAQMLLREYGYRKAFAGNSEIGPQRCGSKTGPFRLHRTDKAQSGCCKAAALSLMYRMKISGKDRVSQPVSPGSGPDSQQSI